MTGGSILVVPCCEKGKGGGHITRSIKLIKELRAAGKEAYLFIPANVKIDSFLQSFQFDKMLVFTEKGIAKKNWELIVLDRNQTPQDELIRWKKLAPVIGIDEGGPNRDYIDFLIDILIPENFEQPPANITSCALIDLPQKTRNPQDARNNKKLKILISFGQEDAAGLAVRAVKKLSKKDFDGMEITLLKGSLFNSKYRIPDNVKIMNSIPNLADRLCEYDFVITHYGITAYEALFAGTNVLLDHPTPYHKKIAKAAGFEDLNNLKSFKKITVNPRLRYARSQTKHTTLTKLLNSLTMQVKRRCPVCGKEANNRSIVRFPDRSFRCCSKCGAIYMERSSPQPVEYKREYFFEEYKKQYGKTYLEDFPNLVAMAKRRLKVISQITSRKNAKHPAGEDWEKTKTLLDIGCAYGPFLAAAKEEGLMPAGIEPAQDAVRYVQKTLGIPVIQGFFPNCPLPSPHSLPYDIVSLWYVIEHFTDCFAILTEIKKILIKGGILAFSTPSFTGISGRKHLRKFLENSPADHYTIWSPKMCVKALAHSGFQVKKTVITGYHPERFPLFGKLAKSKKSPLYWLFLLISKIFGLGDTFEVYAELL